MSIASILVALDSRLQTFATTNGLAVAWENVHFTPPNNNQYLVPRISARSRTPIGVGANSRIRHDGVYQISVFGPSGVGTAWVTGVGDQLVAAFPRGMGLPTTDSRQVVITNVSLAALISEQPNLHLPVLVEWFCFDV
jgi:hypothetical protein